MQAARDRQKSYADKKRKPMDFQVGDKVMLKVSPWKGVVRFGKQGKLNPRYVRPFKVLEKVRAVAYKLELPQELSRVHNTFHVSNLNRCYSDDPLTVPLDGLHVDDKLQFVEEPVEIVDREVKRLKRSRIPLVKVRWNSKRGPEFTWEREDQFKKKYPYLFARATPSSGAALINSTSKKNVSKTDERIDKLADQLSTLVEIVSKKVVAPAPVKAVEETCITCGGAHSWKTNKPSLMSQNNAFQTNLQNNLQNMLSSFFQAQASPSGTLSSNTVPNPKGEMKAITTRSGVAYEGPSIQAKPSPKEVVELETEEITDEEHINFQGSTAQIPPLVISKPIPEPEIPKTLPKSTPIPELEIPKTVPKPNIPYPSRRNDQKNREKASYQKEKIFQMFQDLRFDISFADALFLMPRFAPMIRNLLMKKEKLLELAKIPLNENCSAMLLKKLPEKLGDYSLLSLPDLTPTRMTLELADRSITHPKGLAEDVYVKVGKFHFPTDFVVVDFEADPRVPLILGRSFLRTGRALIDVYGEEITLQVDNEAVTFNLDQTTRYSSTNDKSVNRIDIIDEVCEEYAPELIGFPNDDFSGGNPTLTSEPFTSEFTLEEIDAYLYDKSISLESDYDD
ncbi:reverse transcriptase domain-containing protein, partial [Tanacetum coccineum]